MKLIQRLNQPEREFTPIPFWFLNGDLRDEEIRRQLQDFRNMGYMVLSFIPEWDFQSESAIYHKLFFTI